MQYTPTVLVSLTLDLVCCCGLLGTSQRFIPQAFQEMRPHSLLIEVAGVRVLASTQDHGK